MDNDNFEKFSINENGNITEYSILSTFKIVGNDNDFMIYTDYSINENKKMNLNITKYSMNNGEINLIPITDEDERNSINDYLIEFEEHLN